MMKASFAVRGPVMLALSLVAALASIAFGQTDPHLGTWKLNLAKAKFTPGPPPRSETFIFEPDGQLGLTVLAQGVDALGNPMNPGKNKNTVTIDGKEHPTPSPDYDTTVWKRVDANRYEFSRIKAGKVVMTGSNAVSKDGRTLTYTIKGTIAHGETINNVMVFDKQ